MQVNTNMSDMQYLWIDLCIIFPLAVTMGRTEAYKTLSPYKPNGRLISFPVLASVLGQTLISAVFQTLVAWWCFQNTHFHCDDACPAARVASHLPPFAAQLLAPPSPAPWSSVAVNATGVKATWVMRHAEVTPLAPPAVLAAVWWYVSEVASQRVAVWQRLSWRLPPPPPASLQPAAVAWPALFEKINFKV